MREREREKKQTNSQRKFEKEEERMKELDYVILYSGLYALFLFHI